MPAQIGENLPADNLSDNSGGAAEANNATTDNSDLTGDSGIIEPAIPSTDAALSGYPTDDESMYNDNGGNSKIADSSLASLALPAAAGASSTSRSAATSASSFSALQISPAGNSGAAVTSIPIEVPPGRKGIQPNISLNYNSNGSNGWLGVGWSLDMGAIQRSNKRGVNYTANDYVVMASGSTSELVPIGNNYYSPKIEGAFSRYYKHPTGGWEVTTKDGVIYYYGSSIASRQDNAIGVFKWCLDKIQDTNGNFMTVTYIKDQGEIYLDQIDYTGNTAGLSPANYVKIYRESRPDAPAMYTSNFSVITAYRLKTIEVFANGSRARAYKFSYTSSGNTGRSLLASVQQYGSDALLDAVGTITYGTALPTLNFEFYGGINGFGSGWGLNVDLKGTCTAYPADFNGDGKIDLMRACDNPASNYVWLSTGSGFGSGWGLNVDLKGTCTAYPADFNGDGKHDPMRACNDPASNYVWKTIPSVNDLISSISNGIGGRTAISYKPSSEYSNTLLPFIVQTVNSTTTCDNYNASNSTCQGNTSATAYTYSGGYFDYAEREYRGFEYVKATAPNDTKTETWFKGCTYTNPPDPENSIYKGLTYFQRTKDSSGNRYAETTNTYLYTTQYNGVNFPYLSQKDDYIYDGSSTAKQATTTFTYDPYGNIKEKHYLGDVAVPNDQRYENTEYYLDGEVGSYLVSLPKRTCISDVLITDCNDSNLNIKAREGYTYYLGTGNLFTKTEWLNGGTNPVTTYTYDPYGDVATIKDARNYTTTISYDSTYTYPVQMTNPLGHAVSKAYDARFGKPLTETDQNNNTTTYTYDVFGRIVIITNPYDTSSTYGTVSYYYLNFGTVGSQKVMAYNTEQSGTGNYILTETYFDGLGRTIKTRAEGPDNKTIASQTIYNTMQQVASESLPFFEGETPRYKTYEYDPIGRIKKATLPDGTYATSSYLKGILTYIDPNGHKKVEEKDIYGRAIKIEEYLGVSPSFTLYATTRYEYNVLGNMTKVTDAANNLTIIAYDTLSRKTSMTDPDMGYWTYQYDANGNLTSQTDAKNQTILFTYDALNRITKKDYPTGTDVVYTYDDRIYYF